MDRLIDRQMNKSRKSQSIDDDDDDNNNNNNNNNNNDDNKNNINNNNSPRGAKTACQTRSLLNI